MLQKSNMIKWLSHIKRTSSYASGTSSSPTVATMIVTFGREFLRWAPSIAAASHPWTLPVPDITSALPRPISNIHKNTNTNTKTNANTNTNINIAAASHPWTLPLSARHHNLLSQGLFGCPVLDALI